MGGGGEGEGGVGVVGVTRSLVGLTVIAPCPCRLTIFEILDFTLESCLQPDLSAVIDLD
jgi:hypothetical protein